MPIAVLDSVILQVFPYSETSKVLRVLTESHGVQSLIAKGALRPRNRFGGVLEPFTDGIATAYLKEGRELNTLSAFELSRSRQALGRDLIRFGGASLLAELVLRTGIESADVSLFARVRAGLDRLESASAGVESVVLAELWGLIDHLGFAPALHACIGCGRPLEEDEETSFDYAAGGARCADCARQAPGRPLPASARAVLSRLMAGDAVALDRTGAHWRLLARFLTHHVVQDQPLRSLDFLAETVGADA